MMLNSRLLTLALFCLAIIPVTLQAQVGIGTTTPDANAILELYSGTTPRGLLLPRMSTAQRTTLGGGLGPVHAGMLVADTSNTTGGIFVWDGTAWVQMATGASANPWQTAGSDIYYDAGRVGIGTTAPMFDFQVQKDGGELIAGFIQYGAQSPVIALGRFGGTPGSPAPTGAGLPLGQFLFAGYRTAQPGAGASISAISIDAWTATSSPADMYFSTASTLGGEAQERIRITSEGLVGIGTSSPLASLHIVGTTRISSLTAGLNGGIVRSDVNGQLSLMHFTGNVTDVLRGNGTFGAAPSGAPTGAAGGHLTGTYPNPTVAADVLTGANVVDGSLSGADIALNSIGSGNIIDGNVTTTKLQDGSVTTAKLADGNVTSVKIADGSIVNADINNTAGITDGKLATISTPGKVSGSAITSGTIGGSTAINTTGNITTSGTTTLSGLAGTGGMLNVNATGVVGRTAYTTNADVLRGDGTFGPLPVAGTYIQNQNALDQAANFRINGEGSTLGKFRVGTNNFGSNALLGVDQTNDAIGVQFTSVSPWPTAGYPTLYVQNTGAAGQALRVVSGFSTFEGGGLSIANGNNPPTAGYNLDVNGQTYLRGNTGIGVLPTARLHVQVPATDNASRPAALFENMGQTNITTDFNNYGLQAYGRGNASNYGYGIGGVFLGDQANSFYGTGVLAMLSNSNTVPAFTLDNDAALTADGNNLGAAAVFKRGGVGIGTSFPSGALHVVGTSFFNGAMNLSSNRISGVAAPIAIDDAANKSYVDNYTSPIPAGTVANMSLRWSGTSWVTNGMLANSTVGIGLGVASPSSVIDVRTPGPVVNIRAYTTSTSTGGTLNLGHILDNSTASVAALTNASALGDLQFTGGNGATVVRGASIFAQADENWSAAGHGTRLNIATTANGATNASVRMVIDNAGNVGLGTSFPSERLHVNGGNFRYANGTQAAGRLLQSDANGVATWVDPAGIGVSNANNGLSVAGNTVQLGGALLQSTVVTSNGFDLEFRRGAPSVVSAIKLRNDNNSINAGTGLTLFGTDLANAEASLASINATMTDNATAAHDGFLSFSTTQNAALLERMRITNTGYVGIGTTTPTAGRLSVVSSNGDPAVYGLGSGTGGGGWFESTGAGIALRAESTTSGSALRVRSYGARTNNHIGAEYIIDATTTLNSLTKTGLSLSSIGSWTGVGSVNRGLVVDVSGGTTNYAALFTGGNVGIGTTTPFQNLSIVGTIGPSVSDGVLIDVVNNDPNANSLAGIRFKNNASTANERYNTAIFSRWNNLNSSRNEIAFAVKANSVSNVSTNDIKMMIDETGLVGVGTTTPQSAVHVRQFIPEIFLDNTNVVTTTGTELASIGFGDARGANVRTAEIRAVRDAVSGSSLDLPTRLDFYTTLDGTATQQLNMQIGNDGRVYVRSDIHHVADNGQLFIHSSRTPFDGAYILMNGGDQANPGEAYITHGNFTAATGPASSFRVRYAENSTITNQFSINRLGNVGIGIDNPLNNKVEIVGGAPGVATNLLMLRSEGTTDNTATGIRLSNTTNANGALAYFDILTRRNATTASFALNNGSDRFTVDNTGVVTMPGLGTGTGTAVHWLAGGTLVRNTSSIRYKKDVQDLAATDNVRDVLKLRPVSFVYKETEQLDYGLIAEEVNEVLPQMVITMKDSTGTEQIDGVYYNQLSVRLLSLAQAQDSVITAQQQQIERLEASLKANQTHSSQTAEEFLLEIRALRQEMQSLRTEVDVLKGEDLKAKRD